MTDQDKAILDFEARWTRRTSRKEEQIRTAFNWSATRYHQRLNALIDNPAALVYSPAVVNRLRRQRDRTRSLRLEQSRTA